jgi:hypothetical protein
VRKSWKPGKSFTHICPTPNYFAKIKGRIKQMTDRWLTPVPLDGVIRNMNASVGADCFPFTSLLPPGDL